jgi:hypothetical protein
MLTMALTPIEDLEAFAYAPGEWRSWDAAQWNMELLLFCFLRDHTRTPFSPIRASAVDLTELVREPKADPEELVQALLMAVRWQATEANLDPLADAIHRGKRMQRSGERFPDFFAFLWLTSLIAYGYPDASLDGQWHARFDLLFPRCDSRQLKGLPELWELLAAWLNQEERCFEGHLFTQLVLPTADRNRSNISHSWRLAFPLLLDRRRLSRAFEQLVRRGEVLHCRNLRLLQALEQEQFSSSFLQELTAYRKRLEEQPDESSWFGSVLEREILVFEQADLLLEPQSCASAAAPIRGHVHQRWGPLLLATLEATCLGVLCLHEGDEVVPQDFAVELDDSPIPGRPVLIDSLSDNPGLEAFDAGSLLLDPAYCPFTALMPALQRGLLVFAVDPGLERPRLLLAPQPGLKPSHVLVHVEQLAAFQTCFDAEAAHSEEEDWRCFRDVEATLPELFAFPEPPAAQEDRPQRSRISPYAGLRLGQGRGFLASGLGLPDIRIHGPQPALKVMVLGPSGGLAEYVPCLGSSSAADASTPQQWQPLPQVRQRQQFESGEGRAVAFFQDAPTLEQRLALSVIAAAPCFARQRPLQCREDWGLHLGPSILKRNNSSAPSPEAIEQARTLLNQRSGGVNPWIEQQILDGLCAAFETRQVISTFDALQLFRQLGGRSSHWPLFEKAMLRGWCEGGWLEEGIEVRRGHWRLQPVDPRLVRLDFNRVQLVGLLSARGLIELIGHAAAHGLHVTPVAPSCPEMPRGWRFEGAVEQLAAASGLPLVGLDDWLPLDFTHPWFVEPLACDGEELWPQSTARTEQHPDRIVLNRNGDHQRLNLDPKDQPQAGLNLLQEMNRYRRYRWHSVSPVDGRMFTSCHRNRAALHQLAESTGGVWPFAQPDRFKPVLERCCDADAYLPLPLGRWAALCGDTMPGPTLPHQRSKHTYRYCFDPPSFQLMQHHRSLPLTSVLHA